jgi:hypothetical protein
MRVMVWCVRRCMMGVVVKRAEGDVGVCSFCFVFGLVWHV